MSKTTLNNEQNYLQVQEVIEVIRQKIENRTPQIAIVLGTGLGGLAQVLQNTINIDYTLLPHFPTSTVPSHVGQFTLGTLCNNQGQNVEVIVQQGRCHLYEGYSPAQVCMGIRTMAGLGATSLIMCSATGAVNPQFDIGDLMLITDHINLTGQTPLMGENFPQWGERFPDMSRSYDLEYQTKCLNVANKLNIRLERGVYAGVLGPQLETPAETRFLRHIGADAVGMSTVLEIIAARHLKMRVLGLACLCNKNLPDCMEEVPLEQIIQVATLTEGKLTALIRELAPKLHS